MHWTEIVDRTVGDAVILDVRGYMTLSEPEASLYGFVRFLMEAGTRQIVLNLTHVSYIDSVGVGEIIRSYLHVRQNGGRFRLCGVGPRVSEVLRATQLDAVLQISATESDALRDL
jgi:anti-sigma B factor antagonist